jgi:hypothetical protein
MTKNEKDSDSKKTQKITKSDWIVYGIIIFVDIYLISLFSGAIDLISAAKVFLINPNLVLGMLIGGSGAFVIIFLIGSLVESLFSLKNKNWQFKKALLWTNVILLLLIFTKLSNNLENKPEEQHISKVAVENKNTSIIESPVSYIKKNGFDSSQIGGEGNRVIRKEVLTTKKYISDVQYELLSFVQGQEKYKICDILDDEMRKQLAVDYGLKEKPMFGRISARTESIIACSFDISIGGKSASVVYLYEVYEKDIYILSFVENGLPFRSL